MTKLTKKQLKILQIAVDKESTYPKNEVIFDDVSKLKPISLEKLFIELKASTEKEKKRVRAVFDKIPKEFIKYFYGPEEIIFADINSEDRKRHLKKDGWESKEEKWYIPKSWYDCFVVYKDKESDIKATMSSVYEESMKIKRKNLKMGIITILISLIALSYSIFNGERKNSEIKVLTKRTELLEKRIELLERE
ncbi:MAG TPA: hypothetical protein PK122_01260 [Candidatus Paceibacterota bacterium]|nr:hypothetical protein [Candidatus Paceibacterota bacterium]